MTDVSGDDFSRQPMTDLDEARLGVLEAGRRLVAEGLVARTWGNVSVRIDSDHMLITPSGKQYEQLTAKDIVLVDQKRANIKGL